MGWWSDIRDSFYTVAAAPVVLPVKAATSVLSGKNILKTASDYTAGITAAPYNLYASGIDAVSKYTGVKAASLPIYGTSQNYFKTGDSKAYWQDQAKILTKMGLASGAASLATGNDLGVDLSGIQSEISKYQSGFSQLQSLLPKSYVVAGQTTPSVATYPEAQVSLDKKNLNMALIIGAVVIGSVFLLKGKK